MKRSLLCAALLAGAVFAAAVLAADDAAAIETAIDDTRIELIAPAGYCPLDSTSWPESLLIDFTMDGIKQQGERLAYLVDCERARTWHNGGRSKDVGDIVDYQASLAFRRQNVTGATLKDLCAALRKGDDSSHGWFDLFLKAFKEAMKGRYAGAGDTTLAHVVIGYEDTGCYVFSSTLMKNGEQLYTVSALTAIKSKLVTVHLSKKFGALDAIKGSAEDVINHLLATSRATATALIAANP